MPLDGAYYMKSQSWTPSVAYPVGPSVNIIASSVNIPDDRDPIVKKKIKFLKLISWDKNDSKLDISLIIGLEVMESPARNPTCQRLFSSMKTLPQFF